MTGLLILLAAYLFIATVFLVSLCRIAAEADRRIARESRADDERRAA